ncbi:MAG: right-handed parallel beta-helix repeat-containing protein [Thermomicrobiales bacterium]
MDASRFDDLARSLFHPRSRRAAAGLLGGLALVPALGLTETSGKKKKKVTLCLNGETITASSKARKKLLKQGATVGACQTPPPPCTPQCNGVACGVSDGCGGTCGCAAGSLCYQSTCRSCTVNCASNPIACGNDLSQKLIDGGTIYVCPGTYGGPFDITTPTTLIGAGPGDDPASNTILDGRQVGTTVVVSASATLAQAQVTGRRAIVDAAGGIQIQNVDVQITDCKIKNNQGVKGGGIGVENANARLRLNSSIVEGNSALDWGGGIYLYNTKKSFITDCIIDGNAQTTGPTGSGGGGLAINNAGEGVNITRTRFTRNSAKRNGGGGIHGYFGKVVLDPSTVITDNSTEGATQAGGILQEAGLLQTNGATIENNTPLNCVGAGC